MRPPGGASRGFGNRTADGCGCCVLPSPMRGIGGSQIPQTSGCLCWLSGTVMPRCRNKTRRVGLPRGKRSARDEEAALPSGKTRRGGPSLWWSPGEVRENVGPQRSKCSVPGNRSAEDVKAWYGMLSGDSRAPVFPRSAGRFEQALDERVSRGGGREGRPWGRKNVEVQPPRRTSLFSSAAHLLGRFAPDQYVRARSAAVDVTFCSLIVRGATGMRDRARPEVVDGA